VVGGGESGIFFKTYWKGCVYVGSATALAMLVQGSVNAQK
jgi:hypothetical protein